MRFLLVFFFFTSRKLLEEKSINMVNKEPLCLCLSLSLVINPRIGLQLFSIRFRRPFFFSIVNTYLWSSIIISFIHSSCVRRSSYVVLSFNVVLPSIISFNKLSRRIVYTSIWPIHSFRLLVKLFHNDLLPDILFATSSLHSYSLGPAYILITFFSTGHFKRIYYLLFVYGDTFSINSSSNVH